MKLTGSMTILSLGLALAACQSEPEETPDITEAIPIEGESDESAASDESSAEEGADSAQESEASGTQDNGATENEIMESGSNEGADVFGGEDPAKLQPADPPQ